MSAPRFIVYGLIDPRDRLVHYIGKSSHGLQRPRAHTSKVSLSANTPKARWLNDLLSSGLHYKITVLEAVTDPIAPSASCWWWDGVNATALVDAERWWIAYGRALGWPLTNLTDGGGGMLGWKHKPETIEARRGDGNVSKRPEVNAKRIATMNSPEVKARMSEASSQRWRDPEFRRRWAEARGTEEFKAKQAAVRASPEWKAKMRATTKAFQETPDGAEKLARFRAAGVKHADANRLKMSEMSKALWADPKHRERISKASSEFAGRPDIRARASERAIERWGSADGRARMLEGIRTKEARRKKSEASKRLWSDPEWAREQRKKTAAGLRRDEVRAKISAANRRRGGKSAGPSQLTLNLKHNA